MALSPRFWRSRRGFTLTEAVMVAAIIGIISLVLGALFINISRFSLQATARSNIQSNARTSMELITRKISEAKGHTVTIDQLNASQPNYSRLSFTDIDGNSVSFYQQGTALMQVIGTNQSRLANNLYQMVFTYPMSDDTGLIAVSLTFQEASYQGTTKSLQLSLAKVRIQNPDAY